MADSTLGFDSGVDSEIDSVFDSGPYHGFDSFPYTSSPYWPLAAAQLPQAWQAGRRMRTPQGAASLGTPRSSWPLPAPVPQAWQVFPHSQLLWICGVRIVLFCIVLHVQEGDGFYGSQKSPRYICIYYVRTSVGCPAVSGAALETQMLNASWHPLRPNKRRSPRRQSRRTGNAAAKSIASFEDAKPTDVEAYGSTKTR